MILSGALTAEKKEVPRVTGKQLVEARALMERAGFEVQTERVRSSQPFDQVVDQDPNAGEQADEGSTVTLEVSDGPGTVLVPPVANLRQGQAINELEDAGLKVTVDSEFSDKVKKDFAIRTVPPEGKEVTKGTRVRLLVSAGPEQVAVPDVTGLSRESAEARLRDEGFGVAVVEQESDEPEGDVISQIPCGGTELTRGETVTITVSTGRPQVDVPDVIGLSERSASSRLSSAGLEPVTQERTVTDPAQDGVVVEQRPGPGTQVDRGRQVVIVIGVLEVAEPPPDDHPGRAVRVAVLAGGRSSEHDVSLSSAESVRAGLAEGGHEALDVRIDRDGRWTHEGEPVALEPSGGLLEADVAFPVLHGPFGEDGTVQGLLELLDVPYVGAGVMASAVAMDKAVFKDLMRRTGSRRWTTWRCARAAGHAGAAGVREAGAARLLGGDRQGMVRVRSRRRARGRSSTTRWCSWSASRTASRWSARCSATATRSPHSPVRSCSRTATGTTTRRSTSRVAWSWWCPPACRTRCARRCAGSPSRCSSSWTAPGWHASTSSSRTATGCS